MFIIFTKFCSYQLLKNYVLNTVVFYWFDFNFLLKLSCYKIYLKNETIKKVLVTKLITFEDRHFYSKLVLYQYLTLLLLAALKNTKKPSNFSLKYTHSFSFKLKVIGLPL